MKAIETELHTGRLQGIISKSDQNERRENMEDLWFKKKSSLFHHTFHRCTVANCVLPHIAEDSGEKPDKWD